MNTRSCCRIAALVTAATLAASFAVAQPAKDTTKPATNAKPTAVQPSKDQAHTLPPGMTEADMQACIEAGTPGEMHAHLAEVVGTWNGAVSMWHAPGLPVETSTCTTVFSSMLDGRFVKCETNGEMPSMGPFSGFGLYGYDNVSKQFQCTWVSNCGTGMMVGTGNLSSDGDTLTWNFKTNCPMTKKPMAMREVERRTGDNTMTLEMFGPDPDGKEFKMMEIAYTRAPNAGTKKAAK